MTQNRHGGRIYVNGRSRTKEGKPLIGHGKRVVHPPECPEGKLRCPVCRNVTIETPSSGRLRRHRDLFGFDCYNTTPARAS